MARSVKRTPVTKPPIMLQDIGVLMEEYASKLEEEVAKESRAFRLMADAVPQIVWTSRPDGKPDYFNQRWFEYTGLSEEKSLKSATLGITHPDDIAGVQKAWKASLKTGKPYQAEFRLKDSATGDYRWFLGRALPGRDNDGRITKWFGTLTDIDEHRKSQERKDEFIAIASHELKTPVTTIKAFAQLLSRRLKQAGDNDSVIHIEKMDSQINKLSGLIKELLDISMIDSGKLRLNKQSFDFDEFIKDSAEGLRILGDKHKLVIKGRAKKSVTADKDRIEQVMNNLVSNAVKYSKQADKIVISVSSDARNVKVRVQDFGVGIAKKELKRIFERFFRAGGSKSETFSGLGLGLYISAEIIKRHKGRIWAESQPGRGSTFSFTLPGDK